MTETTNGDASAVASGVTRIPPKSGRLELPQDTIDEILALQRLRRDKTPNAVVAEGVELLRRSIFDKPRKGRQAAS